MATRRQIQDFASDLPDAYLECREYGHAWQPFTVDRVGPRWVVTVECSRCAGQQVRTIDRAGGLVKHPSRRYPHDYLAPGIGRLTGEAKAVLRLEGVRRFNDTNQEEIYQEP